MLKAVTRRASSVDSKLRTLNNSRASASPPLAPLTVASYFDYHASPEDTEVVVEKEDFENAVRELVPSVSVKELEHYSRVRRTFEQGEEGGKEPHAALNTVMQKANGKARESREDDLASNVQGLRLEDGSGQNGYGSANGVPVGSVAKGKGKAKAVQRDDEYDFGFGKATMDDEEELYSP